MGEITMIIATCVLAVAAIASAFIAWKASGAASKSAEAADTANVIAADARNHSMRSADVAERSLGIAESTLSLTKEQWQGRNSANLHDGGVRNLRADHDRKRLGFSERTSNEGIEVTLRNRGPADAVNIRYAFASFHPKVDSTDVHDQKRSVPLLPSGKSHKLSCNLDAGIHKNSSIFRLMISYRDFEEHLLILDYHKPAGTFEKPALRQALLDGKAHLDQPVSLDQIDLRRLAKEIPFDTNVPPTGDLSYP